MGKVEGKNKNWHGHVTAVTVGPGKIFSHLNNKTIEE